MFEKSVNERLSAWVEHRCIVDRSPNPLIEVLEFWRDAPFVPHNNRIDRYYQQNWPTPWEIIENNKYDDFTKALMIGWTLLLTLKFKNSEIVLKTIVDHAQKREYNIIVIDQRWVLNFDDNEIKELKDVPDSCFLENIIELKPPR